MNLINELLQLCIEKNATTEHDVFFEFLGHINVIRVFYYKNGFHKDTPLMLGEFIEMNDEEEIKKAINEIKGIV